MKEIIFTRHGESVVNLSKKISNRVTASSPLTEAGKIQTMALLDKVRDRNISTIYTSPLERAVETANTIGEKLIINVNVEDGLREPDCGILEGRDDEEAWRLHALQEKEWKNGNINFSLTGGESLRKVLDRFDFSLQKIISDQQQRRNNILVISHGSVLRNSLPYFLTNISREFAHSNPIPNCCLIVATHSDNGLICTQWNEKKIS